MTSPYTSLKEILQTYIASVDDVTDELAKWNYLVVYNTSTTTAASCSYSDCSGSGGDYDYFRIGLFAYDLTAFKAACTASDYCTLSDYTEFDGWAIGQYANISSSTTIENGFCTEVDDNCMFITVTSGTYSITSFQASATPEEYIPTVSEITAATEDLLYGFDQFQWVLPVDTVPFAYRFLRPTDDAYWQITDPARVW